MTLGPNCWAPQEGLDRNSGRGLRLFRRQPLPALSPRSVPGAIGAAFPLSGGIGDRASVAGQSHAREEAPPSATRPDGHRGQGAPERARGSKCAVANLLYGSGLRLMGCLRLRVKDIDFETGQITVRDGNGFKDRVTMLPESQMAPLRRYLERGAEIRREDLRAGYGAVYCPTRRPGITPRRAASGAGNTCFRQVSGRSTRIPARNGGIIWTRRYCSARSSRQCVTRLGQAKPASCRTLRDAPAAGGLRHPHDSATARHKGRRHDDDPHPCAEPGRSGGPQPARPPGLTSFCTAPAPAGRREGGNDSAGIEPFTRRRRH